MIYTSTNSTFPDQVVPDAEKATLEYGLSVARAIEGEWFLNYRGGGYRFMNNYAKKPQNTIRKNFLHNHMN